MPDSLHKTHFVFFVAFAGALLLVAGCNSKPTPRGWDTTIGKEGGTLTGHLEDGIQLKLNIPPNAASHSANFKMKLLKPEEAGLSPDFSAIGGYLMDFRPDNVDFSSLPLQLKITIPSISKKPSRYDNRLFHHNETRHTWEPVEAVEIDLSTGSNTYALRHFSTYGIFNGGWRWSGKTILPEGTSSLDYQPLSYKDDQNSYQVMFIPAGLISYERTLDGVSQIPFSKEGFRVYQERVNIYRTLLEDAFLRPEMNDKIQSAELLRGIFRSNVDGVETAGKYVKLSVDGLLWIAEEVNSREAYRQLSGVSNELQFVAAALSAYGGYLYLTDKAQDTLIYLMLADADVSMRIQAFEQLLSTNPSIDPAIRDAFCGVRTGPCPVGAGIKYQLQQVLSQESNLTSFVEYFAKSIIDDAIDEISGLDLVLNAAPHVLCKLVDGISAGVCTVGVMQAKQFSKASSYMERLSYDLAASSTILYGLYGNTYEDLDAITDLLSIEGRTAWENAKMQSYLAYRHASSGINKINLTTDDAGFLPVLANDFIIDRFVPIRNQQLDELVSIQVDGQYSYYRADCMVHGMLDSVAPPIPEISQNSPWARVNKTTVFDASQSQDNSSIVVGSQGFPPRYQWSIDGAPIAGANESILKYTFSTPGDHVIGVSVTPYNGGRDKTRTDTVNVDVENRVVGKPTLMPAQSIWDWEFQTQTEVGSQLSFSGFADVNGIGTVNISEDIDYVVWPGSRVQYVPETTAFTIVGAGPILFIGIWEGSPIGFFRTNSQFLDDDSSYWFSRYLRNLVDRNIIQGYEDGTFRPWQNVNRAEFIKMVVLTRSLRPPEDWRPSPYSTTNPFSDVMEGEWFYSPVMIALSNGIIDSGSTFRPGDSLNRAEAVKIIVQAFNISAPTPLIPRFGDVDPGAWYASYVYKAAYNNVVGGYPDDTFRPANNINRAEAAKIVWQAYKGVTK